jgi:hypothetical protein
MRGGQKPILQCASEGRAMAEADRFVILADDGQTGAPGHAETAGDKEYPANFAGLGT